MVKKFDGFCVQGKVISVLKRKNTKKKSQARETGLPLTPAFWTLPETKKCYQTWTLSQWFIPSGDCGKGWGGETMEETEKGPELGSCVICSTTS